MSSFKKSYFYNDALYIWRLSSSLLIIYTYSPVNSFFSLIVTVRGQVVLIAHILARDKSLSGANFWRGYFPTPPHRFFGESALA
jgi:hypothetical protein